MSDQQASTEDKDTTVRVKTSTRERLGKIGKFEDSYDDIINRLLDLQEKYGGQQ